MTLGMAFRELREKAGLSQRAVAVELECSENYISLVENSHREPSMELIDKAWLFFGYNPYLLAAGRSQLEKHLIFLKGK